MSNRGVDKFEFLESEAAKYRCEIRPAYSRDSILSRKYDVIGIFVFKKVTLNGKSRVSERLMHLVRLVYSTKKEITEFVQSIANHSNTMLKELLDEEGYQP